MSFSVLEYIRPGRFGKRLVKRLAEEGRIGAGLFAGMRYVSESVCGSNPPKLLGVYEIELRPVFEELLRIPFDEIIDIGAAEGYYAAGCALKWPAARVIAYEATEEGRKLLEQVIAANDVCDRVEVRGLCTPEDLQCIPTTAAPRLVIMDVEGAERELLDPNEAPFLKSCHIVLESHDFLDPTVGGECRDRFLATHSVKEIWSRPRRFADYEIPRSRLMRWYMLRSLIAYSCERPCPMRWFYMSPRSSVVNGARTLESRVSRR